MERFGGITLKQETKNIEMKHFRTNITNEPFSMPVVQHLIHKTLKKIQGTRKVRIVDPFARNHRQKGCITVSNDLNPEIDCMYNLEMNDFGQLILEKVLQGELPLFDMIFHDPPYSLRQLKDHYDNIGHDLKKWQTNDMWGTGQDALAKCLKVGGYAISLGWHSHGYGKKRGFQKIGVYVIEQVATKDRYDLIVTIEQKVQHSLTDFVYN